MISKMLLLQLHTNINSIGRIIPQLKKYEFFEVLTYTQNIYPDIFLNHFSQSFTSSSVDISTQLKKIIHEIKVFSLRMQKKSCNEFSKLFNRENNTILHENKFIKNLIKKLYF